MKINSRLVEGIGKIFKKNINILANLRLVLERTKILFLEIKKKID